MHPGLVSGWDHIEGTLVVEKSGSFGENKVHPSSSLLSVLSAPQRKIEQYVANPHHTQESMLLNVLLERNESKLFAIVADCDVVEFFFFV